MQRHLRTSVSDSDEEEVFVVAVHLESGLGKAKATLAEQYLAIKHDYPQSLEYAGEGRALGGRKRSGERE